MRIFTIDRDFVVFRAVTTEYRYLEFFVFDYDSLPISFQWGITFPLVALDNISVGGYRLKFTLIHPVIYEWQFLFQAQTGSLSSIRIGDVFTEC